MSKEFKPFFHPMKNSIQSLVKKIGRLIYKPFGINLHIKTGPGIKNYVSDPNFDAEAFSNQLKL